MRKNVEAGQAMVVPLYNQNNAGLMVQPGVGATAAVEFTFSAADDIEAGTALWASWSAGPVTATTADVFDAMVSAVRVSSFGGDTIFEVRG